MTTVVIYKSGPQGPAGPSGMLLSRSAATDIGGFKVVRELGDGRVALASSDEPLTARMIVGVTLGAASPGETISIIRRGEIIDFSLDLIPGPLFLGLNGSVVSTPPASGALVQIGLASTSGRAVIDLSPVILRAAGIPESVPDNAMIDETGACWVDETGANMAAA